MQMIWWITVGRCLKDKVSEGSFLEGLGVERGWMETEGKATRIGG